MISMQNFRGYFPLTLKLTKRLQFSKLPLRQRIQEWVQQEIVADDPCDEETFFPDKSP